MSNVNKETDKSPKKEDAAKIQANSVKQTEDEEKPPALPPRPKVMF